MIVLPKKASSTSTGGITPRKDSPNYIGWTLPAAFGIITIIGTLLAYQYLPLILSENASIAGTFAIIALGTSATVALVFRKGIRDDWEYGTAYFYKDSTHTQFEVPDEIADKEAFKKEFKARMVANDSKKYLWSWLIPFAIALIISMVGGIEMHDSIQGTLEMPLSVSIITVGGAAMAVAYKIRARFTTKTKEDIHNDLLLDVLTKSLE